MIAVTEATSSMTRPIIPVCASSTTPTMRSDVRPFSEQWQQVIDKLFHWWHDQEHFAQEDFDAPDRPTLDRAVKLAERFRDAVQREPAPDFVVPAAEGGVILERREGASCEMFFFRNEGNDEYVRFINGNVAERFSITSP